MSRNIFTLILLTLLAGTIATVHYFALQYFWYWRFHPLDIPMHFFGGFFIGGATLFLTTRYMERTVWSPVLQGLLGALIIGIGWEVFEKMTGIETGAPFSVYFSDTLIDLFMDILGGGLAAVLFAKVLYTPPRETASGAV